MSRWLLVGEGPSELGSAERPRFLDRLIGDLAGGDTLALANALECPTWHAVNMPDVARCSVAELARGAIGAAELAESGVSPSRFAAATELPPPKLREMARVAARSCRAAAVLGCDAVVVLIDRDNKREREGELAKGFEDCGRPHASGAATETLEAWLLADRKILQESGVRVTKKPEELWGDKKDPDSQHPKCVLRRACEALGIDFDGALDAWDAGRAAPNAPHLAEFCRQIVELLQTLEPAP